MPTDKQLSPNIRLQIESWGSELSRMWSGVRARISKTVGNTKNLARAVLNETSCQKKAGDLVFLFAPRSLRDALVPLELAAIGIREFLRRDQDDVH